MTTWPVRKDQQAHLQAHLQAWSNCQKHELVLT